MNVLRALGGRKFTLTCVLILAAMAAIALKIQVDPVLLDFIKWIAGLFMAGNVGAHFVQRREKGAANAAEAVPQRPREAS